MKKRIAISLILFLIGLSSTFGFSGDSTSKKIQHIVGFGVEFLKSTERFEGHDRSNSIYQQPGLNIFYRLFILNKRFGVSAFTLGSSYRKGYGFQTNGSNAAYSASYGDFEIADWDLGFIQYKRFGKKRTIYIGAGLNIGWTAYTRGIATLESSSPAGKSVKQQDIKYNLANNFLSFNLEFSKAIKLRQKKYLLLGAKFKLGDPDFNYTPVNKSIIVFAAYKI